MKAVLEKIKDIKNFEGLYQITDHGNVISLNYRGNGKAKYLKPSKCGSGYPYVVLYKNHKPKNCHIHKLVAEAFLPNPNNLYEINHKDEIKTNNYVGNLEWCTHEYNYHYGTRIERVAQSLSIPILQYTIDGKLVKEWKSINEAGRNGFICTNIVKCCKGKYGHKTHKGYIWKYKEENTNEKE